MGRGISGASYMKRYSYKKIDAFTSEKSMGNPAACVFFEDNETLTEGEMLYIAKQHKGFVSEMVYCGKSDTADFKLTYYSSECEVDFCGHGTIACMYELINSNAQLKSKKEIIIETNKKGNLCVFNEIEKDNAVYITAPKPVYKGTKLTSEIIADQLGISVSSINIEKPIDLINAGLSTLIVPIRTLKDEVNIFPNEKELKKFCQDNEIDIVLIYSSETDNKGYYMHTRVFAPKFGYLEDPATGSGNSAFGYYLLKNNMWNGDSISIEQGGIDRIYNEVKLLFQNNCVLFGGRATIRIVGDYYL
jgi:PhzF family phenazine biosynthesis protein